MTGEKGGVRRYDRWEHGSVVDTTIDGLEREPDTACSFT